MIDPPREQNGGFDEYEHSSSGSTLNPDWPALTYEELNWTAAPRASFGPAASLTRRAPATYQAAVPAFIADLDARPSSEVLAEAEAATVELTRFDTDLGNRVSAFAPVLLRSEAASSSQIENLTASARAILTAELGGKSGSNAMLIAANTHAMQAAIKLADEMSSQTIQAVHEVLMATQPQHTPGEWRTEPVWIGTNTESPHGATFVAPSSERVPELIQDVVDFAMRDDIPALVQVAVVHAQFETIHPFSDGNGRTGRALAQAVLRRRGITRNVAVPVSAGLIGDISGYHDALTAYRVGDIDPIVRAFANASERAVVNSRRLVSDIDEIKSRWKENVKARSDSGVWPLLDLLACRPVLDAENAARELGVSRTNVYTLLNSLVEKGVLQSKAEHKMGPFWRNDEILGAIDRFAERAIRRTGR